MGAVQLAAALGVYALVTGGDGKDAYGYEQWHWDWAVEMLRNVSPLADSLAITLAIEAGRPL